MANFEDWKQSGDWKAIERMKEQRAKIFQLNPPSGLDMGVCDIPFDMQPYLDELFKLVADLKVPGKKAKGKLLVFIIDNYYFVEYSQMYVRTMFFDKTNPEVAFKIDGNDYWITGAAQNDMWGCKEALVEIFNFLDDG